MSRKEKIVVKPDIDYEQLSAAISKAINTSKEKEKKAEIKAEEEQDKEWQNILGQANFSKIKNGKSFFKHFHYVWQDWIAIWKLCTFKRKDANYTKATYALIQMSTSVMISLIRLILWIAIIVFSIVPFYFKNYKSLLVIIPFVVFLFLIERVIRIAKMEIENTEDKDVINIAYSSLISLISMVLSIIAIIVAIMIG